MLCGSLFARFAMQSCIPYSARIQTKKRNTIVTANAQTYLHEVVKQEIYNHAKISGKHNEPVFFNNPGEEFTTQHHSPQRIRATGKYHRERNPQHEMNILHIPYENSIHPLSGKNLFCKRRA